MKNLQVKDFLRLAALCLFGFFLTIETVAQGAYTDGKVAQLKASDIKKLKTLRAPIAVPTYVPAGYKLKSAGGKTEKLGNFWSVDYWLNYENAKGDRFSINSANEGLGDVPIYGILEGKNPFFAGVIEVGTQEEVEKSKRNSILGCESGWVENKRAYVPAGAHSHMQVYRMDSTALSAKEVLKVMLSLRYLK